MLHEYKMIGDLIFAIHKELKRTLERDLKSYDIGIGQLQILILFYSDTKKSYSQSEISKLLGIDKGNISRSVQKLLEKHYVERHEEDTRLFRLTPSGIQLKTAISEHFMNINDQMIASIDNESLKTTTHTLSLIQERLEKT